MKVTAQDVAQLLVGPPPREVPGHVLRAAKGTGGTVGLLVFGLIFTVFGGGMAAVFVSPRIVDEVKLAAALPEVVAGTVTGARATSISLNKRRVYEFDFSFTAGTGPMTGQSYYTGRHWESGAQVQVEYLPAHPAIARIVGARMTPGGWGTLLVLIFPTIGILVLVGTLVQRRRLAYLVCEGRAREVDVLSCEPLMVRKNKQTVFRARVSHPSEPGAGPVDVQTSDNTLVALLQERLAQKRPIYVLFDPAHPKRLLFPEGWVKK